MCHEENESYKVIVVLGWFVDWEEKHKHITEKWDGFVKKGKLNLWILRKKGKYVRLTVLRKLMGNNSTEKSRRVANHHIQEI